MIIAIDPGTRNLGVWKGDAQHTEHLERFTLKSPCYIAACDLVRDTPWLHDAVGVVIETQAVRNTPARVVAVALYGMFRGLGMPVTFSGPFLKGLAMEKLAERHGYMLEDKPTTAEMPAPQRARRCHTINKRNARGLVLCVFEAMGDTENLKKLQGEKADDMADAFLIGQGYIFKFR